MPYLEYNWGMAKDKITPNLQKVCPICGKPFETPAWEDKTHCSQRCGFDARVKKNLDERTCPHCGYQLYEFKSTKTPLY